MITFRNPGVIDLFAAVTFGVSAKEGDNPIGYFGTGLKYAVSIVLRSGGSVTVWAGLEEHRFTLEPRKVRGSDFDVVCLDGKPLGFTTRVGINWEPWMAFREFYCNALDEGGTCEKGLGEPLAGTTTIQVEGLDACYGERNIIVLPRDSKPLYTIGEVEVFGNASPFVYYRGVRVGEHERKTRYTYNFLGKLDLTEDRTLKDAWQARYRLAEAVLAKAQRTFVRNFFRTDKDSFEAGLAFDYIHETPSEDFLATVGELRRDPTAFLNDSVLKVYVEHAKELTDFDCVQLNEIEQRQLDKAVAFLSLLDHDIQLGNVRIVESLGDGILGRALIEEKIILLPRRVFDLGTKQVASALLEEHIHITKGLRDCSRQLQTYLFDRFISVGERLIGEPL